MIHTHCRHYKPPPEELDQPWLCEQGLDVKTTQAPGQSVLNGLACFAKGRAVGATCPAFAPWTAEEIAADEAERQRVFAAIKDGVCPTCGQPSTRKGNWTVCVPCKKPIAHHTPKSSIDRWCGPE